MPLTAADIMRAFETLEEELFSRGERAEIVIAGGAALVLLFGARETTNDVDAYFVRPEPAVMRQAAARVATRLDLPVLNDAAKGYFVGLTNGSDIYNSPTLTVRAVTTIQLFAMKLCAWRDAVDRSDARLLLSKLEGTKTETWAQVSLRPRPSPRLRMLR